MIHASVEVAKAIGGVSQAGGTRHHQRLVQHFVDQRTLLRASLKDLGRALVEFVGCNVSL